MFAFAVALPAAAEGPNITVVSPSVVSTTEPTQTFHITADKPLASAIVEFSVINGNFEDGDLNNWTTGGDSPWVVSTNTLPWVNAAKQGAYFAHSPLAGELSGEGKTSWLERTLDVHQTSSLMFWAKAYLRYGNDVVLTMDGVELDRFSTVNIASWTQKIYSIPPGSHVMRFTYTRTVDQDASYEAFLLDQFRWVSIGVSSALTVTNGATTGEASTPYAWPYGVMDYRFRVTDLDGNVSYSPITKLAIYSAPIITVLGNNPDTTSIDTVGSYVDAGATAYDVVDGDITASIIVSKDGFSTLGGSRNNFSVTNSAGLTATAVRNVNVVDMTAPVITLIGDATTSTEKFVGIFVDPGATVHDNCTGPQVMPISTTSSFDINAEGEYNYVYLAKDEAGNTGYATRVINVIDTLPPRIYGVANGASYNAPVTLQYDEGAGLLNGESFASGTKVDISGSYTLVVTDTHGLTSSVAFTVVIPAPVVYSSGGGGGGGGGASYSTPVTETTTTVYSIPPEPVVLPQPKPQVLGVKYGATSQIATAKIVLKANGTLIRDSQMRVYIIVNRQKKIISSLTELKKYANKKIYNIVDAEAAMYPDWRPYAVNVLLQSVDGKIYLTQKDGTKWYVATLAEFATYKKLKLYKKVTAANLAYYPNATEKYVAPVVAAVAKTAVSTAKKYAANVLLQSSTGKIYLTLSNGSKYHITSLEELKKYGKLKMYKNISDAILNQYADSATAK